MEWFQVVLQSFSAFGFDGMVAGAIFIVAVMLICNGYGVRFELKPGVKEKK